MEEFLVNMITALIGLLIGGAVFLSVFNWLSEEFTAMGRMDLGEWIIIAIFFGVAALVASTM